MDLKKLKSGTDIRGAALPYENTEVDLTPEAVSKLVKAFAVLLKERNPAAKRAFEQAFEGVFHPLELNYLKNSSETLAFARRYLIDKKKLGEEEFDERLARLNRLYLER